MYILIDRAYKKATYTIGKLYIDGEYFCDTCEDKDRGLSQAMPEAEIIRRKVYGETAVPTGTYEVSMNIVSTKFKYKAWAKPYGGKIPRILNVKGFEGVLIHPGNHANPDSLGCVLVGQNKVKGGVVNSTDTFHRLMARLKGVKEIILTIK